MAYRNATIYGHHTNNFSEVNVRLFKDFVLSRNIAYNAVALVDFICTCMEQYYQKRLRNFVNGRNETARYLYEDQLKKALKIHKEMIEELPGNIFKIKSKNQEVFYEVDVTVGFCTCPKGKVGAFCKHQAAVFHYYGRVMPNLPPITVDARYSLAKLVYGKDVGPKSFYMPLVSNIGTNNNILNQEVDEEPLTLNGFGNITSTNNILLTEKNIQ